MAAVGDFVDRLPPKYRASAYLMLFASGVTVLYFTAIAGPLSNVSALADSNSKRITKVEDNLTTIRDQLSDMKTNQTVTSGQVDDIKKKIDKMDDKLDTLLANQRRQQHGGD
ncbi:MAG: hypothetical protein HY243_14975 [Proteobacteria bacterium]|nr:hypothetical protein [Pseudomonadota bacterium]